MAEQRASYDTYEGFLRSVITDYWESKGRSKVNFLALLLATREAWQVAFSEATDPTAGKKILTGAAGAAAIAVILRAVLGGPLGILLTGASVASLVAIYVKNHRGIWAQVERYRGLVEAYRRRYKEVQDDYVDESIRRDQRDLMMDGLKGRFLAELREPPPDFDDEDDDEDDGIEEAEIVDEGPRSPRKGGFAAHAARRRAEEEQAREGAHEADGDDGDDG